MGQFGSVSSNGSVWSETMKPFQNKSVLAACTSDATNARVEIR